MIRLLVAENKVFFQLGIVKALEPENNIKVISICNTGEETVEKTVELKPDLVLLSSNIAGLDFTEVTKQIRERIKKIYIVLICHDNVKYEDLLSLLRIEIDSYVKDDIPENVLVRLIDDVFKGIRSISPEMQSRLLEEYQDKKLENSFLSKQNLSSRQIEILSLAAKGLSNREIAEKLFIAENTTKTQMSIIIRKLNVTNRQRAVLLALEKGLIDKSALYNHPSF